MCFGDFAVPQCSLCPHNESCTYAAWLFHLFHVNSYCVSTFEKPHLTRYKPGRIFLSHKFKQGHYVPLEEYLKCWIIVFGVQYFSALGLGPSCIRTVFSQGSWSGFSLNPLSKYPSALNGMNTADISFCYRSGISVCFRVYFSVNISRRCKWRAWLCSTGD